MNLEVADDAISTVKLEDDAVTNAKIATAAVDTDELATDAVTTIKIADDAVTPDKIAAGGNGNVLTTVGTNVQWAAPASPFYSLGKIQSDGTELRISGASISYNPSLPGEYTVNFDTPLAVTNTNYIIQLTLLSGTLGYNIQVNNQTNTGFEVLISDSTGNPANATWYFTVIQ